MTAGNLTAGRAFTAVLVTPSGPTTKLSETEELQARREYTRRQLASMDDWDRAFYQGWTSLISRNALAFPYPMGKPRESSKVKLRRSWQRRSVATRDISPNARVTSGGDSVPSPRRQWTSQFGRYDPREQRVLGEYGEGISYLREIPYPTHICWRKLWRMGRQHPDRPKLL